MPQKRQKLGLFFCIGQICSFKSELVSDSITVEQKCGPGLLSNSQAVPGRNLSQPRAHLLVKFCRGGVILWHSSHRLKSPSRADSKSRIEDENEFAKFAFDFNLNSIHLMSSLLGFFSSAR